MPRPLMQHGVGQLEEMFAGSKSDIKVLKQLANELKHRQVPRAVTLLRKVQAALNAAAPTSEAAPPAKSKENPARQPDLWGRPPLELTAAKSTSELFRPPVLETEPGERAMKAETPPLPMELKDDADAEDAITRDSVETPQVTAVSTPVKPPTALSPEGAVPAPPPRSNAKEERAESRPQSPVVQAADMPVSEAYKLLKATPSSTWESIEQTRRRLVEQSSPVLLASLGGDERAQILSGAKRVNAAYAVLWRARTGASG